MEISFRSTKLQKACSDAKGRRKKFGMRCGDLLGRRLDDLRAALNLEQMRHLPGRCHELKGDRKGQLAIDLEHPKRLIFEPVKHADSSSRTLEWSEVTEVVIMEVVNYHRK